MERYTSESQFTKLTSRRPDAWARIMGSRDYPSIRGIARFYQTPSGVVVSVYISGLPSTDKPCDDRIYGFHVHNGNSCTGTEEEPFADAGSHYDPYGCPHPYHAGDLPPLFGAGSIAFSVFLTNRFTVRDILGKTVILHDSPGDFTSQPAGNAGERIACGTVYSNR